MISAKEFLHKYNQDSSLIDTPSIISDIINEADKGLTTKSSIPMIPTYINPNIEIKKNKRYIVIDAGGTNFRSAVAYYTDTWHLEADEEVRMPGVRIELSKEEFFFSVARNIKHLLDDANDIGFCFSYQVAMDNNLDGRLVSWSKEIKAKEVIGELIGKNLLDCLKKYSPVERSIVVINDTTAVLLGGKLKDINNECDSYIGFIFGTGMNVCYIEDNANIKKIANLENGKMIINTEASNYKGFTMGVFDKESDNESALPGNGVIEKLTSGKYLANLIYKALTSAIKEEVIYKDTILPSLKEFTLPLVSGFLDGQDNRLKQVIRNDDLAFVNDICYEIIDRASKITAIICSAYAIKSSKDRSKPIGVIVEGTTFYRLPTFKERYMFYLNECLVPYGIKFKMIDGRGMNLIGTALAAMLK